MLSPPSNILLVQMHSRPCPREGEPGCWAGSWFPPACSGGFFPLSHLLPQIHNPAQHSALLKDHLEKYSAFDCFSDVKARMFGKSQKLQVKKKKKAQHQSLLHLCSSLCSWSSQRISETNNLTPLHSVLSTKHNTSTWLRSSFVAFRLRPSV